MCSAVPSSDSLLSQLKMALEKEQEQWSQWSRIIGVKQEEQLVGLDERDKAVGWLCRLSRSLILGPDTLSLAAAIIDKTLLSTHVKTKYYRVLALSAFYVACKICEEPEAVLPIADLVRQAGCVCSVQELVRMERVLLKRLNWDLSLVTPYTFLQLMLAISLPSDVGSTIASFLRPYLEKLCCSAGLALTYRPSLLAASLLSVTLERQRHPQWFLVTVNVQTLLSASLEKIIACREHLAGYIWPRERLLCEQNRATNTTEFRQPLVGRTFDEAGMKPPRRVVRAADGGNAENVYCPPRGCAIGGIACHTGNNNQSGSRKRQRRKSRCSEGGVRVKTAPEEIYIDEIYDAVQMLYGPEKLR